MFKSKLILEPYEKEGRFRVVSPLIYESEIEGVTVFVPWGFDTDGASIPPIFNELWKVGGKKMAAAVIHDYLYRTHLVSKDIADRIFLEAMVELNIPVWKRQIMYYAVRIFGNRAWNKSYKGDN